MEFTYEEKLACWKTLARMNGCEISLRIFSPELRPGSTKVELAAEVIQKMENMRARIETVLLAQLYPIYLDSWADDGAPAVDKTAFVASLVLNALHLDVEDESQASIFLYYDDAQLFGGHGVEVFWDGTEDEINVEIVG